MCRGCRARAAAHAASWHAETEALVGQYQHAIEVHARLRPRGRLREAVLQLA